MVKFREIIGAGYDEPGEFMMNFRQWFLELSIAKQALLIILLIIIAVGLIYLLYYLFMGLGYILYYSFKITLFLLYYIFLGIYFIMKLIFVDIPKAILGIHANSQEKDKISHRRKESFNKTFRKNPIGERPLIHTNRRQYGACCKGNNYKNNNNRYLWRSRYYNDALDGLNNNSRFSGIYRSKKNYDKNNRRYLQSLRDNLKENSKIKCPMCGGKFTDEMVILLKNNKKTFCEFCGHGLELVIR